jgi:cell wall-associated NlpC family hydrolase
MRYLVWLSLVITFHILPLTSLHAQWNHLQSGDLLFVSDTTGMGQAVKASTGNYTHVAMVERAGDSLFVIDATQKRGVARRPIEKTFANKMPVEIYRLTVSFDTAAVIERAKSLIGKPYDNAFLPENDAYYCSELIQTAFGDLFESKPMNWRDKEGKLPDYWKKHFEELGIPVPEGVPGTNPTDMSRSPLLRPISQ